MAAQPKSADTIKSSDRFLREKADFLFNAIFSPYNLVLCFYEDYPAGIKIIDLKGNNVKY